MLSFVFIVGYVSANTGCEAGWAYFNGNCYKHIVDNSKVIYEEAFYECAARNSVISGVESPEELNFLKDIGTRIGSWNSAVDPLSAPAACITGGGPYYTDYLLVNGRRKPKTRTNYWVGSNSTWFPTWCSTEPTMNDAMVEYCTALQFNPACLWDVNCHNEYRFQDINPWKFLHYVCKKPAVVYPGGAEMKSDLTCACRENYFDITDIDIPEGRDYKKGEKCIPRSPCQNVTSKGSDLSIIFVVDSSQSIGASNWQNMVTFLKSGSRLLDNSIKVGFVKFSTNVSYSDWLPKRWIQRDYLDETPSSFDAGYTNPPAALDAARELFKDVRCENKIAVLITDGMPFVADILPQELAVEKTREAAKQLRKSDIELVALGYGKELRKYQSYLKEILARPKSDYFEYDGEACDFKEIHMSFLLNKVCERFK